MAAVSAAAGATAQSAAASGKSHTVKHHTSKSRHRHKTHARAKHISAKPAATDRAAAGAQVSVPAPVAGPTSCADAWLVPTAGNLDRVRAALLCLVDQQRAAAGLGGLGENADLDAAGLRHSADMVASDYFDHTPPTGVSLVDQVLQAGYATVGTLVDLGENIAAGLGAQATPAATVEVWMSSPGHRDNVLNPSFAETGIGVVAASPAVLGSGGAGATYTEWFGTAG